METMVAVMIMIGAMIVIGSSWSSNMMRIEKARINANMAALLERKMVELDLLYRGKPVSEIKEEDSGEFEDPNMKGYSWQMRSKEMEMPDLTGAIGANADSSQKELLIMIAKTIQEYVKTTVKEVTVTVTYKSNRVRAKLLKQSISTYFIDYSKPISVGGLPGGAAGASQ